MGPPAPGSSRSHASRRPARSARRRALSSGRRRATHRCSAASPPRLGLCRELARAGTAATRYGRQSPPAWCRCPSDGECVLRCVGPLVPRSSPPPSPAAPRGRPCPFAARTTAGPSWSRPWPPAAAASAAASPRSSRPASPLASVPYLRLSSSWRLLCPLGLYVLADLILRPAEEPPLLHVFNEARGIPRVQRCSFTEAIRRLARRAAVTLPAG